MGSRGIDEIKDHSCLEDVDWSGVELKNFNESQIPFVPYIKDEEKNIEDKNSFYKIKNITLF